MIAKFATGFALVAAAIVASGCTSPPGPTTTNSRALVTPLREPSSTAGATTAAVANDKVVHELVLRGGNVYDGTGKPPFIGDIAIDGDTIASVGPFALGKTIVDLHGLAVAPGFINMLSHAYESLAFDGEGQSDLRQGVTLEVFGETSPHPFGQKMQALADQGVSLNIAGLVASSQARAQSMSLRPGAHPTALEVQRMRAVVAKAMDEGALGLTSALIYTPDNAFTTDELTALAAEAAAHDGIYAAHIRNEGDKLIEAIDEMIAIAKSAHVPVEIYHFKQAGRANWGKLDEAIAHVEAAQQAGVAIGADMYVYEAASTGLDAAMPPWVRDGGNAAWLKRLRDPAARARCRAEMESTTTDWDNFFAGAGPDGMLLTGFHSKALQPLIGKTLAEVAKARGKSAAETAMDLVVEDGSRAQVIYFLMNDANVRREIGLPWMTFGSDSDTRTVAGAHGSVHPRAYGNVAKLLGHYVRDEHAAPLAGVIHRLSGLAAERLHLERRGQLAAGYFADIVVFDPAKVIDRATYVKPHAYSEGVREVWVNGVSVLHEGEPTGATPGRFIHRRAPAPK
ncbi:MAG TPA: amidohydrolase family protein [Polyangia bacterium]|nr:amidohydrolase family protein [Polyangia bacterium]